MPGKQLCGDEEQMDDYEDYVIWLVVKGARKLRALTHLYTIIQHCFVGCSFRLHYPHGAEEVLRPAASCTLKYATARFSRPPNL